MCIDICISGQTVVLCIGIMMCIDMCVECVGMCVGLYEDMHTDVCEDMCIEVLIDTSILNHKPRNTLLSNNIFSSRCRLHASRTAPE